MKVLFGPDPIEFPVNPGERPRYHWICSVCGTQEPWGPEWRSWASLADEECLQLPVVFCGATCRDSKPGKILQKRAEALPNHRFDPGGTKPWSDEQLRDARGK